MKKITIISIFLLVLLVSNIVFAETGIVSTPAVRIREKASTNSEILTKAYEDDEVEILGEEGDWYKVKFDGKTGYASKSLIKKKENNTAKNETPANNTTTNNTNATTPNKTDNNEGNKSEEPDNQNATSTIKEDTVVRVMPNFASNEMALLTKDTKVEVLKELNNWCQISVNGSFAWVLKNKINMPNESATSTDTQKPEENTTPTENTVTNTTNNSTATNTNTSNTNTNTSASNIVANNTVGNNTTSNTTTSNNTATNTTATNTTATNTTASNNQTAKNSKGKVNVETANVRSKASTSSARIGTLDVGDEVKIIEEEGDWYKITGSGIESGYVSKSLITILKD